MNNTLKSLLAAGAAVVIAGAARAVPTLTLTDIVNGNTITVVDGDGNDSSSLTGVVTFNGSLGDWTVNVSTGLSDSPDATIGHGLDLNSVDKSSKAGTLQITFGDGGFTLPAAGHELKADIGGTLGSSTGKWLTYTTQLNGNPATSLSFTNSPFSGSATKDYALISTPFSLSQTVTIHHTQAAQTSFDANVGVPDGGLTALLVGMGLLGTGIAARRRRLV